MTVSVFWFIMGVGLVAYALTGGADYGGGVWHLLARGPKGHKVRAAIENAIAPIWEANHVWLIFLIVMMFTVFPRAFAVLATALHIPITIALIGMVLRGSAFVMRAYGMETPKHRSAWGAAFGVSSVLTPVLLGMTLGAMASGHIRVEGSLVVSGFFAGWLTPFALAVGLFALCLFALLAATYLAYETRDDVRRHFRRRALFMEAVSGVMSMVVLWRAAVDAPLLYEGLNQTRWAIPAQGLVLLLAIAAAWSLWKERYALARGCVAFQVAVIIIGFGLAMDGHIVLPDVDLAAGGPRGEVMNALIPALAMGAVIVVPSLWLLFRLFKAPRRPAAEP